MNRIDNISSVPSPQRLTETQNTKEVSRDLAGKINTDLKPKQSQFLQRFEKIKSDDVRVKLEGIFEEIVEKSKDMEETLSLKNFVEYKKLVKEFMGIATENTHVFSQDSSLDRRGRRRVYSMIKQVDRELEGITREFLSNHVDHANVLKNMDEITGMLIDIMG